jgi:acyl-coenzyme A synthetase/AMP-(fatty) acid ligase
MNFIDKFLSVVQVNPAAPACIYQGRVMSRAQLHQMVCHFAQALHQHGVGEGETVGVSLNHSPAHLAVIVALARLGAISLPVHPSTPPAGKLRLMKQFGAKRAITLKPVQAETGSAAAPAGIEVIGLDELNPTGGVKPLDLGFTAYWPQAATLGRIGLTSGTTGQPNAVCYSHEYWLHRIASTVEDCDANTRLMPGNLHLTMGNIGAYAALFGGGVVVFHKQHDLASFMDSINLHAVTHAMMAPAMIKDVAAHIAFEGNAFPSLKYLRIVGDGLSEQLVRLAQSRITPAVHLPYGISEVGAISMATPELLASHPDHAGRPKPGVRIEVVDDAGEVLPAGAVGELRVQVPGMPQSYYMNPERTAQKFRGGWFYTSDMGCISPDGLVKIEGRSDDRINLGGVKLYPERVESVLNAHPEVKEAAVFAIPDTQGNKVLVAVVVANHEGALMHKLADYCHERKLGQLMPKQFFLVKELPRNPTGKIIRADLPALVRKLREKVH